MIHDMMLWDSTILSPRRGADSEDNIFSATFGCLGTLDSVIIRTPCDMWVRAGNFTSQDFDILPRSFCADSLSPQISATFRK